MKHNRISKQIQFIIEIDKVKKIFRQNHLADGSRNENDAEHSWHIAIMAFIVYEYFPEMVDMVKVLKMTLMHDLVEIDAGDTYCYDEIGGINKLEREQKAANKLYSLLPKDQAEEFLLLWEEFEECKTPEARFSAILDRLQPLLLNFMAQGKSWKANKISRDQVLKRNEIIKENSEVLWEVVQDVVDEAVRLGYLIRDKKDC